MKECANLFLSRKERNLSKEGLTDEKVKTGESLGMNKGTKEPLE
jgi:hypothetical protein